MSVGTAWIPLGAAALGVAAITVARAESQMLQRIGYVHAVRSDQIDAGCEARLSRESGPLPVSAQQALDRLPAHLCIGKVPAQIWIDETSYYFCKRCDGEATQEEIRSTSYVVNATSGVVEVVPEYGF